MVYKLTFADGHSEALKVIDTSVYRDPARRKDANRRGRSEIQHHQQLTAKTETVVRLFDTASIPLSRERGQDAPMCFLLRMELLTPLDPKNLAALDPANREKAVLQIMQGVLEALCQTEDAGIIHRASNVETFSCGTIQPPARAALCSVILAWQDHSIHEPTEVSSPSAVPATT